jgi:peptidoglycan/xylan/chitin deacetylase (PgdA/CDA1 family)
VLPVGVNSDFLKRLPGRILWHLPFPFGVVQMLGSTYSLRCVVFHDVSDRLSSFTDGLGVTMTTQAFEEAIRFLARHYTPVSLEEVLRSRIAGASARRSVLVTFDDAYASVALNAAPICQKYGVPALFLVNARFLNNRELALDNLLCHVANTFGYRTINAVAAEVIGSDQDLRSRRQVLGSFVPSLSLKLRQTFYDALTDAAGIHSRETAAEAKLYISADQLSQLAVSNVEIGSHTYSHVHGRILEESEFAEEIDRNRLVLESVTGKRVRAFSVPYGSSEDLPPSLASHIQQRGYEAVFLGGRLMNTSATDARHLYRVSIQAGSDADLFSELEIMPRLRALRGSLHPATQSTCLTA